MSETAENWVKVAERGTVAPGVVVGVQVGELDIAVYNIDGQFYATDNACTHAHALLSDGWLEGDIIECPLHGGRFEIKTGKGVAPPITCDLRTFPVRIQGNEIEVNVA
jgi:nitrite reductase/ring-hydroxylating ferredoxin subunit